LNSEVELEALDFFYNLSIWTMLQKKKEFFLGRLIF